MSDLDPFLHPIPDKFLTDPELRPFFEYLVRWCYQVWLRTGGSTDEVANQQLREFYPWVSETFEADMLTGLYGSQQQETSTSDLTSLYAAQSERQRFNAVSTSSNYTAVDYDWINAKSNATITLPLYPAEGSEIVIRNGDGSEIKIDGNGRNINGSSTGTLRREGTSIKFKSFTAHNEWFAI